MTNKYTNMLQSVNKAIKSIVLWCFLLLTTSVIAPAQTGPGGVGNQNGTDGQPRNVLWLDASTLTPGLADGADVTSWTDRSGNTVTFTTTTNSPNAPEFVLSGLNGLPVVRFNGSNSERLVRTGFADMPTNGITTIIVIKEATIETGGSAIVSYATGTGNSSNGYTIFNRNNGVLRTYVNNDQQGSGDLTGGFKIFSSRWKNSGELTHHLNSDAESSTTSSSTVAVTAGGALALGGEQDAVDGDYAANQDLDGDIAEIIMFSASISNADRLIVENYLSQKYGITITNDFFGNLPAYDASYFTDLRGIGSDGTDTRTDALASDALTLLETNGSLDADEYVMLAHNNTLHANNITTEIADATNVTDRWARDWYVEVNRGGGASGVGGGDVSVEMVFDFTAAGFANPGTPGNYVLLYRSTSTGDFDRVFADSYTLEDADKIVVSVPASRLKTGYYTLGTGNPLLVQTWYVFQDGNWSNPSTWTTDASTAPQLKNPANEVPAPADEVIIRSGRTVTIQPGQNNKAVNAIKVDGNLNVTTTTGHQFGTINGSGIIRLAGYNFGTNRVDNFPGGVTNGNIGFTDADNGGTVAINASFDLTLNKARTFRNLTINLTDATKKVILGEDLTLNGALNITRGGFQFGTATGTANRTLTVAKDVSVAAAGRITTANTNQRHTFTLEGNFTSDGNVRFTNRTNFASDADRRNPDHNYYTSAPNNGIVNVVFTNDNADQTADFRNTTYFYRIVIDKGEDATYKLLLKASSASHFRLLGAANDNVDGNGQTAAQNTNAFALINGTAEIGGNVEIPVLSRTGNYGISSTARLWVNGGEVVKHGGAIVPYGVLEVSDGKLEVPGRNGVTLRANGLFKVDGGTATVNQVRTSVQGAGSLGGYNQSGGTVVVDGLFGEGNASNDDYYNFSLTYPGNVFIMSGGTLTVRNTQGPGALFINSDPGNVEVTGGTVVVESSGTNLAAITSRAPFFNLTVSNSINSTDANAKVAVSGGTSGSPGDDPRTISSAPDLVVLNDLTIETGTTRNAGPNTYGGYLDLCPDGTSCANLEVERNLTINDSGVLDLFTDATDNVGSATLTFNGTENGILYVGDITTYTATLTGYDDPDENESYVDYRLPIYDLVVDKSGDTLQLQAKNPGVEDGAGILTASNGKNLDSNNARLLYIRNGLTVSGGSTLNQIDPSGNQFGYIVRVYATEINVDGNLLVYEQGVNPLNSFLEVREQDEPTVGDVILINSTDESTIGNLVVDLGNDELRLGSDLTVSRMAYRHGGVNLGTHNLKVDILDLNTESSGDNRRLRDGNGEYLFGDNRSGAEQYFFTAGNASDGGLSIKVPRVTNVHGTSDEQNVGFDPSYDNRNHEYQNNNLLFFPTGIKDKYTPAVCYIAADGTYSGDEYVTVRPVDSELQTTNLSGGDVLPYYWNVDFEGFAGGEEPTVSWLFQYDQNDVSGTEANYVPGKVLDGGDYTRSDDGDEDAVKHGGNSGNSGTDESGNIMGNNPGNIIIFNGITAASDANDNIDTGTGDKIFNDGGTPDLSNNPVDDNWQNAFPGPGFTLENANYTAGVANRFTGSVQRYYSALSVTFSTSNDSWTETSSWSTLGHNSNTNTGTYPQAG